MELTKEEAALVFNALDKVQVVGLEAQQRILSLATKLQVFLNEDEDGDDVPTAPE